jgi:hypothetical protein
MGSLTKRAYFRLRILPSANARIVNVMRSHDTPRLLAFADTLGRRRARSHPPPLPRDSTASPTSSNDGRFDPVTDADQAAERAMLALIEREFPDHGVLGEEYGERESRSGYNGSSIRSTARAPSSPACPPGAC